MHNALSEKNCTNQALIGLTSSTYLVICSFQTFANILHHFDCHSCHVFQPHASRNFPKGALPQKRLQQVLGGRGREFVSKGQFVGVGRLCGRHV